MHRGFDRICGSSLGRVQPKRAATLAFVAQIHINPSTSINTSSSSSSLSLSTFTPALDKLQLLASFSSAHITLGPILNDCCVTTCIVNTQDG